MIAKFFLTLAPLLGINLFSALVSAFLVSPFITIIDMAITLNTNGSMGLM